MRRSKRPRLGSASRAPTAGGAATAGPAPPRATARGGGGRQVTGPQPAAQAPVEPLPAADAAAGPSSGAACGQAPAAELRDMVKELVKETIGQLMDEGRRGMSETGDAAGGIEEMGEDTGAGRDTTFFPFLSPAPDNNLHINLGLGGQGVTASLRQRIIGHRYVDMRTLLLSSEGHTGDDQQFLVAQNGRISFSPAGKRDLTESQWVKAFLRYASVYIEEYPGEAAAIIAYMSTVMSLCSQGLGRAWRDYDESFRKARENSPAAYPWDRPPQTIWMGAVANGLAALRSAMQAPRATKTQPAQQQQQQLGLGPRRFPKCRDFNSRGGCTWPNCRYQHACEKCGGTHGKFQCPDLSQEGRRAIGYGGSIAPPQ